MTKFFFHIIILLCLLTTAAYAQDETIVADLTSGCDSLTVQFTLEDARAIDTYASIVWDFGDGASASNTLNPQHNYSVPGVYSVTCLLDGGRLIEEIDLISLGLTPFADFTFIDSLPEDELLNYLFSARYFTPVEGIGLNYLWTFPDGSESTDSLANFTFDEENIYTISLELTDDNGCSDTIQKLVPISKKLLVPNVFTPNGDQINDYFTVTTPGDYSYSFRIFSRAGLQVYYSDSPELSWDGRTIGGREAPEGVYFYVIESDETPVATEISGFVHLFR
jgi:gliding motility-associated-like protein